MNVAEAEKDFANLVDKVYAEGISVDLERSSRGKKVGGHDGASARHPPNTILISPPYAPARFCIGLRFAGQAGGAFG